MAETQSTATSGIIVENLFVGDRVVESWITEMKRKYTFASFWNCSKRRSGKNETGVYFAVLTRLLSKCSATCTTAADDADAVAEEEEEAPLNDCEVPPGNGTMR